MTQKVVDSETWLAARRQLLAREKEFTELRDELSAARRRLPWQLVGTEYRFQREAGDMSLRAVTLAVAVPAGLAFCLPMGSPATAIALSSGYLRVRDMLLPGLIVKAGAMALFAATATLWWPIAGLDIAQPEITIHAPGGAPGGP